MGLPSSNKQKRKEDIMQNPTDLTSCDSKPSLAMDKEPFSRAMIFPPPHHLARRSFIRSLGIGAALLAPGAGLLGASRQALDPAEAETPSAATTGDVAILRFLAAAELL